MMETNPDVPTRTIECIAPAHAMQISVAGYTPGRFVLTAPLEPNINDKGTAFAGSIASLLVLAGWGLVTEELKQAGIEAEVVVTKSETDYKRPIRAAMQATAIAAAEKIGQLIGDVKENGRATIGINIELRSEDTLCAAMTASYAARPKAVG